MTAEPIRRVAVISLHTSPLLQPGSGDSGGMNVYVRELMSSLSQTGVECVTFTRADREDLPAEVFVEPNHRVVHIEAGPHHLPKEALPEISDQFCHGVMEWFRANGAPDVIHGNYWLSGVVGHHLKHELGVPFVSTFHTLARVKAEGGDPEPVWRDRAEAEIIKCSDAICVSCVEEEEQFRRLYGDPNGHIEIIAPGVEQALFAPGAQAGARHALGEDPDVPVLLFVGRIQPLKGPDVAIRALWRLHQAGRSTARLLIVGGASGHEGDLETERAHSLVDELGLHEHVEFISPQPHHILSTYYRAADVVIVPSRSESFGLVALEAMACGIPVVASAVGGLQSLVDDGVTGRLIDGRNPLDFAAAIGEILNDDEVRISMGKAAVEKASTYTWAAAAARLAALYDDIASRPMVQCR
ncbi:glycosyltransferase [Ilumatobacter coccineus]|uniref:Glycosyltransferase MshA n=1 Tax=Ilumatobacter coccineus (strain NBRC 103263 / KCTC 29153 / YM16-304) TaxID=1313172 RepID=A0A6C7E8W9_ILUCY|nr:glycosyltransferase [Ilumatobacter coccineus]BAN04104.1 glycosyltransferase MshA [Ilumatobacter coccineus YM16-304]